MSSNETTSVAAAIGGLAFSSMNTPNAASNSSNNYPLATASNQIQGTGTVSLIGQSNSSRANGAAYFQSMAGVPSTNQQEAIAFLDSSINVSATIIPPELIQASQQYYDYVPQSQIAKIKAANVTRKRSSMLSNYPNDHHNNQLNAVSSLQMVPLPSSPNRRPSPALQTTSNTSTAMATPGMGSANPKNTNNNPYIQTLGAGPTSTPQQFHHMIPSSNHHSYLQHLTNQSIVMQQQQQQQNVSRLGNINSDAGNGLSPPHNNSQLQQISPKTRATMMMNMTLHQSGGEQFSKMILGTTSSLGLGNSQLKKTISNGQQSNNPFINLQQQTPILGRQNPLTGGAQLQPQLNTSALMAQITNQPPNYRQRSLVPPSSNNGYQPSANGIAGSFLNLYPTQCEDAQTIPNDQVEESPAADSILNQSNITVAGEQTTASNNSSPIKAFKSPHQGSTSQTVGQLLQQQTPGNSMLSTALSSTYNNTTTGTNKKKQGAGQTTTLQTVNVNNTSSITPNAKVNLQNMKPQATLNSSFISAGSSNLGFNQQPVNPPPQQLVIITVSTNSQIPNLSAGAPNAKKITSSLNIAGSATGGSGQNIYPTSAQQAGAQQITTNDHKDPKQALLMSIQEIVRLVVQRSEDINLLRQAVDIKAKKFKPKYTDSSFYYNLLQREWQRQSVEGYHLNKTGNVRVEDKSPLIKTLQKQVKKMLKPFNRRRLNEDYLQAEVHLSEVLLSQDIEVSTSYFIQQAIQASSHPSLPTVQSLLYSQEIQSQVQNPSANKDKEYPPPQYKDLRKRPVRIIQASFKETLVDPQVALSICIQYSRQAFFDEVSEYFQCSQDIILAAVPGTIPTNCNLQTENLNYQNLKKVITKARLQARVQLNLPKKLDKVYKVLYDQNLETVRQIQQYKDHYTEVQKRIHLSKSVCEQSPTKHATARKEPGTLSMSPNKTERLAGITTSSLIEQPSFINATNISKHQTSNNVATYSDIKVEKSSISYRGDTSVENNIKMNSTMGNFLQQTASGGTNKTVQLNNAGNLLRGSQRGMSKLQPIAVVPRSEIIPAHVMSTPSKNLNSLETSLIEANSHSLSRTIKKSTQLPALQTNTSLANPALQDQLLGGNTLSKRGGGLEPLLSDQLSAMESKIATLRNQQQTCETISPLKRRTKVALGNEHQPNLLKVINSAVDVNESVDSSSTSRKVIKATITIPMPKADLGAVRFKTAKKEQKMTEDEQEIEMAFEDEEESPRIGNKESVPPEFRSDQSIINPKVSIQQQHQSLSSSSSTSQSKLGGSNLHSHISGLSTVRQSASTSKIGNYAHKTSSFLSPSTTGYPLTLHHQSALLFQRPAVALLDVSKFPVNDRFDSLFSRYFNKKGIMAFILNHRAKVLQRFIRARMMFKLQAKTLIVKRFRQFVARQQRVHLFATKLFITVTQKKAVRAIERAYIRYRDRLRSTIKQNKRGTESSMSHQPPFSIQELGAQILDKHEENVLQIQRIQRFYRKRLGKRFALGRKLVKRKDMITKIMHSWWQQRYLPTSAYEAQLLHNHVQFAHFKQFIEEYAHSLQENYLQELFKYDQGLIKAVETNFRDREWFYSNQNKEWQSERNQIFFKSTQSTNLSGGHHPALQHLIDQNRRLLMTAPFQTFEELQGIADPIGGLYATEHRNQRHQILNKIKRRRHEALLNPLASPSFCKAPIPFKGADA